ncbi:homoserine kinase [soil metagenome]
MRRSYVVMAEPHITSTTEPEPPSQSGKKLTLRIPGSTANLGPGFDCFGLALSLYCRLTFTLLETKHNDTPLITFAGAIAQSSLPQDTGNLVYKILRQLWQDQPDMLDRIRIHVDSDIPLGCGLGSSAAAILGALWADNVFKDRVPTTGSLLAQASLIEGHSETLAASLMGKFVITAPSASSNSIVARQMNWPSTWRTIFVVPSYRMKTEKSRAVLPKTVSHTDAVWNMQRAAMFISAISTCDENTLKEALHDRLHEPYREVLVPELASLRRAMVNQPILGCVLSAGGPSMLVIVNERHRADVLAHIEEWAAAQHDHPRVLDLRVDDDGIRQIRGF